MTKEVKAYYAGRNDHYYGDPRRTAKDFGTRGEWESYKRGWRHSSGEAALDMDTEWDD
jgi:hypothetical protein